MEKLLSGRRCGLLRALQAYNVAHRPISFTTMTVRSRPRRCIAPTLPSSETALSQHTLHRACLLQQHKSTTAEGREEEGTSVKGVMSALYLAQVVRDGDAGQLVRMAHLLHNGEEVLNGNLSQLKCEETDYAACLRALAHIARHMHSSAATIHSEAVVYKASSTTALRDDQNANVQHATQRQLYAAIVHRMWLLKQTHWQSQRYTHYLHSSPQVSSSLTTDKPLVTEWSMQAEANVVLALLATPCMPRESLTSLQLLLDIFTSYNTETAPTQRCCVECALYVLRELPRLATTTSHVIQNSNSKTPHHQKEHDCGQDVEQVQSCLPWLLYYLLTHTNTSQPALVLDVPHETQSAWVNAAANALCAASWTELHDNSTESEAMGVMQQEWTSGSLLSTHSLPCFAKYWRLTLTTLLESALDTLDTLAQGQDKSVAAPLESHLVGAFVSLRRVLCSLARHRRLQPIIELYTHVTGHTGLDTTPLTKECHAASVQRVTEWHTRLIAGHYLCTRRTRAALLLWRESILFDAYALITLGHAAERALDLPHTTTTTPSSVQCSSNTGSLSQQTQQGGALRARVVALLQHLQQQCLTHLRVLSYTTDTPMKSETQDVNDKQRVALRIYIQRSLAGRVRDGLLHRLQEALRLSIKALYYLHEMRAITEFYTAHAAYLCGANWEAAAAFLSLNEPHKALDVLTEFLRNTRRRFLAAGLPQATRDLLLRTIRATAQHCITHNITTSVNNSIKDTACNTPTEGDLQESMDEAVIQAAATQVMKDYISLRQHGWCLAPALLFDAQMDGLLLHRSVTHRVGLRVACVVLQRYVMQYSESDGLLTQTVSRLVDAIAALHTETNTNDTTQQQSTQNRTGKTGEDEELFALQTLVQLLYRCPHLPIVRISLTSFLAVHDTRGVYTVLQALCCGTNMPRRFSESYIQAVLGTLSVRTLQSLQQQQLRQSETNNKSGDNSVIDEALSAALVRVEEGQLQQGLITSPQPWRCVLCHNWNHRQTSHCYLCQTLAMALVRCGHCGTFSTTLHTQCPLCRTAFRLPASMKDIAGNIKKVVSGTSKGPTQSITSNNLQQQEDDDDEEGNVTVYPLRAWRCTYCQHRNSPTQAFVCLACQRLRPTLTSAPIIHAGVKRTHELPLIPSSSSTNSSRSASSSVKCTCCGQVNKMAMLRPWCKVCGSWHGPTVTTTSLEQETQTCKEKATSLLPAHATLWYCLECHHFNPWLLDVCGQCHGAHDDQRLLLGQEQQKHSDSEGWCVFPWQTLRCPTCQAQNALGNRVCYKCNEGLALPHAVQRQLERGRAAWLSTIFTSSPPAEVVPTSSHEQQQQQQVDTTSNAQMSDVPRCVTCHAALTTTTTPPTVNVDTKESLCCCCPVCYAVQPGYTLHVWVCLHNSCLTVNHTYTHAARDELNTTGEVDCDDDEEEEDMSAMSLQCQACGHYTTWWQLAGVEDSKEVQPCTKHTVFDDDEEEQSTSWQEGVHLPAVPCGQTCRCSACHCYLTPYNIARICPRCGHCGADGAANGNKTDTLRVLELRLLLHELHVKLNQLCHTDIDDDVKAKRWCLSFAESAVRALRQTPADTLPWSRTQLTSSAMSGDKKEERHYDSAIGQLRVVINDLCDIASRVQASLQTPTQYYSNEVDAEYYASKAWLVQRPWLRLALRLVDLANDTTAYDELGFDLLRKLSTCIQPGQSAQAAQETRWAYLRNMKLSRERMVGDVVCPYCLTCHAKSKKAQCALAEAAAATTQN